jgi:hypothetical protein
VEGGCGQLRARSLTAPLFKLNVHLPIQHQRTED